MKKNNFRFSTETFHINHIESPVNQYIDQITEKIFNNNCLSENKHQFNYVTIWLDQVRIAMLKTEIYSNEDVFCYLKPRLEFASNYIYIHAFIHAFINTMLAVMPLIIILSVLAIVIVNSSTSSYSYITVYRIIHVVS